MQKILFFTLYSVSILANAGTCLTDRTSGAIFNNATYINGTIICSYNDLSSYTINDIKPPTGFNWKKTCVPTAGDPSVCTGSQLLTCDGRTANNNVDSCAFSQ